MRRPLISVLLPVCNGEQFLRQALDSVLAQSLRDHEVIVVDDGSTDRTAEILKEYQSSDDRVAVNHQAASGIVASLNTALGLASGEYIARMDCDDIAIPDRFERQIRFLHEHPGVGVLGGSAVVIDIDGRPIGSLRYPVEDRQIRAALVETNAFCHPATMMRRSALQAVGGYRHAFPHAEDYDLWLRISEHFQMANLREAVLRYRFHAGQVSIRELQQQLLEVVAARVSLKLRRARQSDPFGQDEVVSLELLQHLGLDRAAVQSQILSEVAIRATVLVSIGQNRQAREMLARAVQGVDLALIDRRTQARIGVANARARFGSGSAADGMAWLLMAGLAHPTFVCQAAWRGARDVGFPRIASLLKREA